MRRSIAGLALVTTTLLGTASFSRADITFKLPPPPLTTLVPLAALPLDKPQVALPVVPPPPPPQGLPTLPAPKLLTTPGQRPVAPLSSPRILACNPLGTMFGVASELLECGRARYQKGEFEEARVALQATIQQNPERPILQEARYWLGQTLLRLGRPGDVERVYLLVVQADPRSEFGLYAADELGWVALELGDPQRALSHFDGLLKLNPRPVLRAYARHGRAMALYGLGRYPEGRDEWRTLLNAGGFSAPDVPRALAGEVNFWLGETLGRLGDFKGAASRLEIFTAATPPPFMIESGLLRRGWWGRPAGQPKEAIAAYRRLLTGYPRASEAPWARLGLVQALLDIDDYQAAREEARQLEATDRNSPLALPAWLLMRRWLADKSKPEEARALDENLLARTLEPDTRAWVLLMSADLARQSGQVDDARSRLELVRQSPSTPAINFYAALRLAQLDFDAREFARAEASAKNLLSEPLSPELRAATLLLAGEAAYWARDYDGAAEFYERSLSEQPQQRDAPLIVLALGWAELRRGRPNIARERWTRFASEAPTDPRAADALVLSAELFARAGDVASAQRLLGEVVTRFPKTEQADVATLNNAILGMKAGRTGEALTALSQLAQRAPQSSHIGRVRLARGAALLAMGRWREAQPDFRVALGQGEDVVAHLGLGGVALEQAQWDAATREFTAARDASTGEAAAMAECGLAAVAFNQRQAAEFTRLAKPLLSRPDDPRTTPHLLLGMEAVAREEKRWQDARELTVRLVTRFPEQSAAGTAVSDLAAGAAAGGQWQLAREMYGTLRTRYPSQPETPASRLLFGEALLRTGAPQEARKELEGFVASFPQDPGMPQALLLLAEAQEATGDRAGALELYARIARDYPRAASEGRSLVAGARLLAADGKWTEARAMLERALGESDVNVVAEAAYQLGEGLRAAGQNQDAVEAYMTGAYAAPDSIWARKALLGAGQSFTALKQADSAIIVYKKLLAASGVEPDLATTARTQLKALGVN
jgi:TolA-binding protein